MRRHIISFIKGTALRRAGALKNSGRSLASKFELPQEIESLARQLQILPDQDFGTEFFLEAWSAEETSGFVSIRKISSCRFEESEALSFDSKVFWL